MKKIMVIGSEEVGKYEYISLKIKKRALEEGSNVFVVESGNKIRQLLEENDVNIATCIGENTIVIIEMKGENDRVAFRTKNIESAKEWYLLFSDDDELSQLQSWIDNSDDIFVFQIQNKKTLTFATLLHISEEKLKRIPKYENIHIKTNH